MKFIANNAPTFFGYFISVLALVLNQHFIKEIKAQHCIALLRTMLSLPLFDINKRGTDLADRLCDKISDKFELWTYFQNFGHSERPFSL